MKHGIDIISPHLKDIGRPALRKSSKSPQVIIVFPLPLPGAAIITRGTFHLCHYSSHPFFFLLFSLSHPMF